MEQQNNQGHNDDYNMSKKEHKEAKKEAQREEARRKSKSAKTRSIAIWLVAFAVLILGVWGLTRLTGPSTEQPYLTTDVIDPSENMKGPANAPITIIEYADFQCPACRQYYPVVNQILENYPKDVRFVFRHYPISQLHSNAQDASQSAESAGKQGKFFEMHDLLYSRQSAWENSPRAKSIFQGYAEELGLDVEKYKSDFNSSAVKDKVRNDYDSGVQAGVTGTPTFFVNGEHIQNPAGFEPFRQIIDAILEQIANTTNASIKDGGNYVIGGDGVVREADDTTNTQTTDENAQ